MTPGDAMRDAGRLWEDWLIDLLMAATRRRSGDSGAQDDDDTNEDGDDLAPTVRRVVQAAGAPAPLVRAPRSVFELAQAMESGPVRLHRYCVPKSATGCAPSASAPPRRVVSTVARAGAVVRVSGLAYPGGRWTAEKAEKERARRARQTPPRPSAAAREFRIGKGAAPHAVPGPLVPLPVPAAGAAVLA